MLRVLRIILGIGVVGLVLHTADLATRDCRLAPYVYENCMWIKLRTHLGLPASHFLRMGAFECVGIFLTLVLYLTFRFVFPFRKATPPAPDSHAERVSGPPGN